LSKWLKGANETQKNCADQNQLCGQNQTDHPTDNAADGKIHTKQIMGEEANDCATYRKNQIDNPNGNPKNLLHAKRVMMANVQNSATPDVRCQPRKGAGPTGLYARESGTDLSRHSTATTETAIPLPARDSGRSCVQRF